MLKSTLCAAAAVGGATTLAASGAHAQDYFGADQGFYVSGGGSYLEFDGENGVDAEVNAVTGRAGLQFNNWLSLEADASFGFEDSDFTFNGDEDEFNLDDNSDGDVADVINAPGEFGLNYMIAAYARGTFAISERFGVSGRAGYAFADVESTVDTPGGSTIELGDSESGPSFGASASWFLTTNQSIRLDYTYTDFDLASTDQLGLMYQVRF